MKQLFYLLLAAFTLGACTNYGKKVTDHHIEVYYKDGITKEEAEKAAKLLYESDQAVGNKPDQKSIQLTRNGDTINFRMVTVAEKLKGMEDDVFVTMGNVISEKIFNGKPVNIDLTNNRFSTIRTIHFSKENTEEKFGTKYADGKIEVYTSAKITPELGQEMATMLNKEIDPSGAISFQLDQDENDHYIVRMVTAADKVDQLTNEQLNEMCATISSKTLGGAPLTFELTNGAFKALRTYNYTPATSGIDTAEVKQ
ncbi:MAG: hypothetical protein NTW29_09355 [Bacteroidetes bacterium]|nr:hypothetical protein [Bacteroidota bacterium]